MAVSILDLDDREQEIVRWLASNFPRPGDVPYALTSVVALSGNQASRAREVAGILHLRGVQSFGVVSDGAHQREFVGFYRRTSNAGAAEVAEVFARVGTPDGITDRQNEAVLYSCIGVVVNLGNRYDGGFQVVEGLDLPG